MATYSLQIQSVMKNMTYLPRRILSDLQRDHYLQKAAALTYTTLFAIVPLLTVTYSMFSAIPAFHDVGQQIQHFIFSNFVPSAGNSVSNYLSDFSRQARNLTAVGMLFLLVTALLMLRTIDQSINTIFHTASNRKGIGCFLLYWAILTLGPLLLGLGFALTSYLTTIKLIPHISDLPGGSSILAALFLQLLSLLLSTCAFTLLYLAVPNCKVKFIHAVTGAFFVAVISYLMRGAFGIFLTLSHSYELIYGAFAFVPIFLVWIYLNWLIILMGACIVNALRQNNYHPQAPSLPTLLVACILLSQLNDAFSKGEALIYKDIKKSCTLITIEQWEIVTHWLENQQLIFSQPNNGFSLQRPLHSINTAEFICTCPWPIPGNDAIAQITESTASTDIEQIINELKRINNFQHEQLNKTLADFIAPKA